MTKFVRLTPAAIRGLKPGMRIAEHGIVVDGLPGGDARFLIERMIAGKRIHRVIGLRSTGVNRTRCEEVLSKLEADARDGRFGMPKGRKTPRSFAQAAADYLERMEESGGKNLAVKHRHLRAAQAQPPRPAGSLNAFFGSMRLDAIDAFAIERFKKARREAGAAPATINRETASLGHMLNRSVEWNWLDRPVRLVQLPEPAGRIVALTDEEIARLMQAAITGADLDLPLFLEIALGTSMRHGEILRIQWRDLDLPNLRLHIPQAKSGARVQPITRQLAELLAREREMRNDREGWIFRSRYANSSEGHRHDMNRPFRTAVLRAGLNPEKVTPHTLRHTAITRLVQAGVDLPTVQQISGHKTLTMVLRYSHVHGAHINNAMTALERTSRTSQELHRDEPAA